MTALGIEEIRSLFLFEQLSDEQLEWIAERADRRTFDEGVVVYREGGARHASVRAAQRRPAPAAPAVG